MYIIESNCIVIYIVRGSLPSQRIIPNDNHCDINNGINNNNNNNNNNGINNKSNNNNDNNNNNNNNGIDNKSKIKI